MPYDLMAKPKSKANSEEFEKPKKSCNGTKSVLVELNQPDHSHHSSEQIEDIKTSNENLRN